MNLTKKMIAIFAITFGVLFTTTALLSIWKVIPSMDGTSITSRLIPSLALLTVAFIVLLTIVKVMEEKN